MTTRRGETGTAASAWHGGVALRAILWNGWRATLVGVGVGLGLVAVATWLLSTRDAHYDRPGVPALVYVLAVLAATFAGRLVAALVTAAAGAASMDYYFVTPLHQLNLSRELDIATVCVATVDAGGAVEVVAAGHPPPVLFEAGAPPRVVPVPASPPLGVGPLEPGGAASERRPIVLRLEPATTLLLYTDGLVEGRSASGSDVRWGLPGLLRFTGDAAPPASQDALAALVAAATAANGRGLPDDVALLTVTVR